MPKKIVAGEYEGSTITVENTWFGGAKLLHNDKVIASNNNFFAVSKTKPLMSATIELNDVKHVVEVYGYAIITVKLQIKVNGSYIAGDKF